MIKGVEHIREREMIEEEVRYIVVLRYGTTARLNRKEGLLLSYYHTITTRPDHYSVDVSIVLLVLACPPSFAFFVTLIITHISLSVVRVIQAVRTYAPNQHTIAADCQLVTLLNQSE